MTTLHDILWNLRNDDLIYRLKLLEPKPKQTRKADLIAGIKAALSGEGLEAIWESLNDLEQAAVAETCYAPDLTFNPSRIRAKCGAVPSFCNSPEDRSHFGSSSWNSKYATRLNLLIFTQRDSIDRIVPVDLAERLRAFIPEPPEFTVPTLDAPVEEENLLVRETEHESLAEVIALLRLADLGKMRISVKTGKVSNAACRMILDCLSNGDFFPVDVAYKSGKRSYEQEIGAIKPIGWARLLQVGRYFTQNGSQSKLTPSGRKALSQPPHQTIRHLWTQWLSNTNYDEFNRIDEIKGQGSKGHMTAKPPRREVIDDALSECPVNRWIGVDKFSDYMLGSGHEFEVSRDHWKLYLCEARYGSLGYEGYGSWNIVQFRYLLCFLFEYAATLGLIDIAYVHPRDGLDDYCGQWGADDLEWLSRYDGLRAFRITDLGAYCFGITSGYKPRPLESSLSLSVLASLRIQVLSGTPSPAEKLLLETWAEQVEPDLWQLEATRALEAVERGHSVADFTAFLKRYDDQPLPDTVAGFLQASESDGRALQNRGEAKLFDCRDAATATLICAQTELQGQCLRCGETSLAVPDAHLPKFRKVVRSLGLGIV